MSRVRARQFIADALRGFPFKGVGVSREKVLFKLVKGHQKKRAGIILFSFFEVHRITYGTRGREPFCESKTLCPRKFIYHFTQRQNTPLIMAERGAPLKARVPYGSPFNFHPITPITRRKTKRLTSTLNYDILNALINSNSTRTIWKNYSKAF